MTRPRDGDGTHDRTGPVATPPELLGMPGYLARRLHQAYVAYWSRNIDPELTGPQFAVLTAVRRHPGTDQGSAAEAVALDSSTMADVARRLEARGLLARVADPVDGRRKLLYPSSEAERMVTETTARLGEVDESLLAPLSTDEKSAFLRSLRTLVEHWEHLAES